ncbi:hypothetical protein L3X38_035615 [Prunus dulcis]|uniref:Uncharacterized protein n=1 Tax=Prunus dulcis TaxID=3755 RepID=A0AAD4YYV3_PRUDU|nr:hypothetical protein L3X38_035615 [Prunus dulcis]
MAKPKLCRDDSFSENPKTEETRLKERMRVLFDKPWVGFLKIFSCNGVMELWSYGASRPSCFSSSSSSSTSSVSKVVIFSSSQGSSHLSSGSKHCSSTSCSMQ